MTNTFIESGYAIKAGHEDYYEVNGLGDWSLAGNAQSAELFTDEEEAKDALKNSVGETDGTYYKIIKFSRFTIAFDGDNEILSEKIMQLMREITNEKSK